MSRAKRYPVPGCLMRLNRVTPLPEWTATTILAMIGLFAGCSSSTEPTSFKLEAITSLTASASVNALVLPAPAVRATTLSGAPLSGIEVEFLAAPGGIVRHRRVTTGDDGVAAVGSWSLGLVAQTYTVAAQANGAPAVVFSADASPGPLSRLEVRDGNFQLGKPNETLSAPLTVLVTDDFNNPIRLAPVTFSVLSGSGTISSGVVLTGQDGLATSGAWTLGASSGTQRVKAQVHNLEIVFAATSCDEACRGNQLLFVRNGKLYRTQLGGASVQLTSSGRDAQPAWSPDGRKIAFERYDISVDRTDIYVMNVDGSGLTRVAEDLHVPSWSPDGHRLATASADWILGPSIYLVELDDPASPPNGIATMASTPAWSPDGSRIAFVNTSGDFSGQDELRVMDADGSHEAILSPRDELLIGRPSWSPDGSQIAFAKCWVSCDVYSVSADGSNLKRLTNVGNARDPAWSPDGTLIAISWTKQDEAGVLSSSIAFIPSVGGDPVQVIANGGSPAWFPSPATASVIREKR